jgi:uncharacterized membrane protein (DUF373 family)
VAAREDAPDDDESAAIGLGDRALNLGEDVAYGLAGVVLLAGSAALLAKAAYDLATGLDDGVVHTTRGVLDTLLLLFVFLELLAAIRATMKERTLVAEPFILVGIIATIKEVVVSSIDTGEAIGTPEFDDLITKMAVLTGLLLVLALSSFLLRRKEREPSETGASS